MGSNSGAVAAALGRAPAALRSAVREVEHPAVVSFAAAQVEAVASGEDADRVGGDQREQGVERAAGRGRRERDAAARSPQLWDGGRGGGVDVSQRSGCRRPSGERAAEELVEVLPQDADSREVVVVERPARGKADGSEPVVERLRRVEPVDACAEATPDRGDQVQRDAAGVEAKITDTARDAMIVGVDRCNVITHYNSCKGADMAVGVCVFDLYGTLIDLGGLQRAVPAGRDGEALVALWRTKQLEYSWTHTIIGRHPDFETLAEQALDWTLARLTIDDENLRSALLDVYADLSGHADAEPCLRELRALGIPCAVLSNGSPQMLERVLARSGLARLVGDVVSVEQVGVFKPDPRVYQFAADELGVEPADLAFATANAWDAAGAAAAGLSVHWINRTNAPDEYGLRGTVSELTNLAALASLLGR
jgi:2-haloacid dehalogenase